MIHSLNVLIDIAPIFQCLSYSLFWACSTGNGEEQLYCWGSLVPVEVSHGSVRASGIFSSNDKLLTRKNITALRRTVQSIWRYKVSEADLKVNLASEINYVMWDTNAFLEGSFPFYCHSKASLGFGSQVQSHLCMNYLRSYVLTVGIHRLHLGKSNSRVSRGFIARWCANLHMEQCSGFGWRKALLQLSWDIMDIWCLQCFLWWLDLCCTPLCYSCLWKCSRSFQWSGKLFGTTVIA